MAKRLEDLAKEVATTFSIHKPYENCTYVYTYKVGDYEVQFRMKKKPESEEKKFDVV